MFNPQTCSWERFARICASPWGGCFLQGEDQPIGISQHAVAYLNDVLDRIEAEEKRERRRVMIERAHWRTIERLGRKNTTWDRLLEEDAND